MNRKMDNPYSPGVRRRGQSPPVKNAFQRELEAKMRDRHSRGLSTGISDEELSSEDGMFLSFFNRVSINSK